MSYQYPYYHGKDGSFSINAVDVAIKKWQLTESAGNFDVTSTTDGGYYRGQGGVKKVSGTLECDWLASSSPEALGFAAGAYLSTVVCYANKTDTKGWSFPQVYVESVEATNSVDGVVTYTVTWTNHGSYTAPS